MGRLHLIMGPMFSGKSASLLALCRKYRAIGKTVMMINHCSDMRYTGNGITTHDGDSMSCHRISELTEMLALTDYDGSDVVLINEGQFFPDLTKVLIVEADNTDKTFVVCGLSGGYLRQSVGQMLDLIPFAESVEKLTGFCQICADGTPGEFTCRRPHVESESLIGGKELYLCTCRTHYIQQNLI
jgi:thymidine kinase